MPKHSSQILELARKGAEHKYQELKAEMAALVKQFPHLAAKQREAISRGLATVSRRGQAAAPTTVNDLAPRKRRKMSAKARAAISAAQKARWAKLKTASKTK